MTPEEQAAEARVSGMLAALQELISYWDMMPLQLFMDLAHFADTTMQSIEIINAERGDDEQTGQHHIGYLSCGTGRRAICAANTGKKTDTPRIPGR